MLTITFDNGSVDVTYGPAIVYEVMELYKGLEPNGGVIRFPLAQLTMQILIRKAKFPAEFGQKSREFFLSRFDQGVELVNRYEDKIPEKWWTFIPDSDKTNYNEVFRQARIKLRDKGIYNAKMLTVMRRLRCKKNHIKPNALLQIRNNFSLKYRPHPVTQHYFLK